MATNANTSLEALQPVLTEVGDFDRLAEGYLVIAHIPENVRAEIYKIQSALSSHIPPSSLWLPKDDQLHMTFAHVVSPDVAYPEERSTLFEQTYPLVHDALAGATQTAKGTHVVFDRVEVFPSAVILQGTDDGTIAKARAMYTEAATLPEGTRKPPAIIHTTIARFHEQVPMETVHGAVAGVCPNIGFDIEKLQLIHEDQMYTQSYSIIEEF